VPSKKTKSALQFNNICPHERCPPKYYKVPSKKIESALPKNCPPKKLKVPSILIFFAPIKSALQKIAKCPPKYYKVPSRKKNQNTLQKIRIAIQKIVWEKSLFCLSDFVLG